MTNYIFIKNNVKLMEIHMLWSAVTRICDLYEKKTLNDMKKKSYINILVCMKKKNPILHSFYSIIILHKYFIFHYKTIMK